MTDKYRPGCGRYEDALKTPDPRYRRGKEDSVIPEPKSILRKQPTRRRRISPWMLAVVIILMVVGFRWGKPLGDAILLIAAKWIGL